MILSIFFRIAFCIKNIFLIRLAYTIFLFFCFAQTWAQKIDSLQKVLEKTTGQQQADVLAELSSAYLYQNPDNSLKYGGMALEKARLFKYKAGQMAALNNIGNYYMLRLQEGDLEKAFQNYIEAYNTIENPKETKEFLEKAKALNGLANIYFQWGDYQQALTDTKNALAIRQKFNDQIGIARSYNTLGNISDALADYKNAVDYYSQALEIYKKTSRQIDIAGVLNNLASSLKLLEQTSNKEPDLEQVVSYYKQSLQISKSINDVAGIARSLNNMGIIYQNQKDYKKALELYFDALSYTEDSGSLEGLASTYNNIAGVFEAQKDYQTALEYYNKAVEVGYKLQAKLETQIALKKMAGIQYTLGNYSEAYDMLKASNALNDEIDQAENARRLANLSARFKIEKQQKELEKQRYQSEIRTQENRVIMGFVAFLLVVTALVAVFWFRQSQLRQQAAQILENFNKELEQSHGSIRQEKEQLLSEKELIETKNISLQDAFKRLSEKNHNLADSIVYARRIQDGLLPSRETFKNAFKESLVFYKPKSIISGDFYWYFSNDVDKIIIVGDCTGHGVPGALMTMMANTLLNEIVKTNHIYSPKEILTQLDKRISSSYKIDIADGLDLGVLRLDTYTQQVSFAGAKIPLWRIRDKELEIIKGNSFQVSGFKRRDLKIFQETTFPYFAGDRYYIFTDGLIDQFGGANPAQKYLAKRLKIFMEKIKDMTMAEQQVQINKEIIIWKENARQTDDITMIGLQI